MSKHIFKYSFLIVILCFYLQTKAQKVNIYNSVPVLTVVSSEHQPDTMGFNFAAQLPEIIYRHILNGEVTLWDSPKKTLQITADALQSIEKGTNTSFAKSKFIFLNELWTSTQKKFSFDLIGLSFMNESSKGKVSYGYIDIDEAAPLLYKEQIKANANGSAFVSYMAALYSRRYIFSVVQFGSTNLEENLSVSSKIKEEALDINKKHLTQIYLKPIKEILYSIDKEPNNKNGEGFKIFEGLEELLSNNLEIFFELGADRYFDFKKYRSEFSITRIEVEEVWQKHEDQILMIPRSITIYVNNKKLNSISMDELRILKFNIGLKSVEDLLLEKQFNFQLVRINKSYIRQDDAQLYLKAMTEFSWTQLSRYVKFSKTEQ